MSAPPPNYVPAMATCPACKSPEIRQSLFVPCESCHETFKKKCGPQDYWMDLRLADFGEPLCSHCGHLNPATHWFPARIHLECLVCGFQTEKRQGI